jgi:2-iminobutanoate/2-iminopropanoate deaminase
VAIKRVHTDRAPAAIGPYSQGIIAGGFLFTAGQAGLDPRTGKLVPGDVVPQAERTLANLHAVIEAAGASWNDVVKTTVYLKDIADFARMNQVYAKTLGDARPARSTVQVAALPEGALVEIDAVVRLPE